MVDSTVAKLPQKQFNFINSVLSGGLAGTVVDLVLFPLDTLKTRLQSKHGFIKAGGFGKVYSGLSSALLGSAPSAALFFVTYDYIKRIGKNETFVSPVGLHMLAASFGEMAACLVRVPTDVVKQRMQVGLFPSLSRAAIDVKQKHGVFGFYRGLQMTIFREIPFACIQFPLFEKLKEVWIGDKRSDALSSIKAGLCGMIAGGTAAAITTPLDVIRTRTMLSSKAGSTPKVSKVFFDIWRQNPRYFLAGIIPRVFWISIGGSIFLGIYDFAQQTLSN